MSIPVFSSKTMRTRRKQRGLTHKALAYYAQVSVKTIENYEAGRSKPSAEQWECLCNIFSQKQLSEPPDTWRKVQEQFTYTPVTFTFTEGQCYSILDRKTRGCCTVADWNVDVLSTLRYTGKHGIHHCFTEIHSGWRRTYTDAQLIGKTIKEVTP